MASRSGTHPQLKTPLVREALLEIRFSSSPDLPYGIVPGRLYEALKTQFAKPVELPLAKIPAEFGLDEVVRHRFLSDDESRMFQVGTGVLSINHIAYRGFQRFSADCEQVLKVAIEEIKLIAEIKRIGLRYINKAPLDRAWQEMIQLRITAPDIVESSAQVRLHRWLTGFPDIGVLSTTIAWPVKEQDSAVIVIDFDHYTEPASVLTVNQIMTWVDSAHENIYQVFKASLMPVYFSQLMEG